MQGALTGRRKEGDPVRETTSLHTRVNAFPIACRESPFCFMLAGLLFVKSWFLFQSLQVCQTECQRPQKKD